MPISMASTYGLLFALIALTLAAPQPALDARQDTITSSATCSAAATVSAEAACISGRGTAFVESVCSDLTSTAVEYSTTIVPRTTTRTLTVATSYTSTRTRSYSRSTTVRTTITYTSTVRVTSGTTTSIAGTVTTGIVRTSTQYTCPNSATSAVFPTTASSDDTLGMKRRQASSTCFPYFRTQYGLEGIIQACRCLRPSSAIATTTITLSARATSGTTTVTASITAGGRSTTRTTTTITSTRVITASDVTSTTIRVVVPSITTVSSTRITTVTSAYPLPTGRFRIFMNIGGQKLYGRNTQAASNTSGTDVIALSPGRSGASSWGFNPLMNLILAAAQLKIAVEQNTWDVPFVYLVPGNLPVPDPWTAPTFAPCNGTLVPTGSQSNYIFAACFSGNSPNRRLAFGAPGVWNDNVNRDQGDAAEAVNNGTCVTGNLGIEAVSGSLTPIPGSGSSTTSQTTTSDTTSSSSSTTTTSESTTDDSVFPTGPLARTAPGY